MLGPLPRIIRTVSMPERLFRERHRRICAVGMFQDKRSALGVATAFILRASEDWALRRYMDMTPLKALYTKFAT